MNKLLFKILSISRFHFFLGSALVISLLLGVNTIYSNINYQQPVVNQAPVNDKVIENAPAINSDQPIESSDQSNKATKNQPTSTSNATSGSSTSPGESNNSNASGTPSGSGSGETLSATVAFYADSQTDENPPGEGENHQRVVNYILGTSANPVFHAGDLMEDGTQASLDSFNSVTSNLRSSRSFYSALGNNDRLYGDSSTPSPLYLNNFSYPNNEKWFSVNRGNLHMIVLDSAFSANNSEQLAWLNSDLQSSESKNRITGVIYHHPSGTLENNIIQSLTDFNVDFVIRGHIHSYGHSASNGIHFFTLSGQQSIGYIIARVYSSYANLTAFDSSNNLIETVLVSNR